MGKGQPDPGGADLTASPVESVEGTSGSRHPTWAIPTAGAILGVALVLVIALTAAEIVAAFLPLYRPALRAAAVLEQITPPAGRLPASDVEFEDALVHVLAYCNGRVDDAQVMLRAETPGGEVVSVPGLSPDEVTHLADVRGLFAAAKRLRNLLAFFLAGVMLPLAMTAPQRLRQHGRQTLLWTGVGTLVLLVAALVAVAGGFDAAFDRFHRLLFRNDLWLLPADSLLITMLPGWLFARLAAVIAATTAVIGGLAGLIGLRWSAAASDGVGGQS